MKTLRPLKEAYQASREWYAAAVSERVAPHVRNRAANAALEYTGIALLVLAVVVVVWRFLLPTITCTAGNAKEAAGNTHSVDTSSGVVTTAAVTTSAAC